MPKALSTKSRLAADAEKLDGVTRSPFVAKTDRAERVEFHGFATTETCELSCVFCHFNGPNATKEAKTLDPALFEKGLRQVPAGQKVHFAATGDFLQDPHALDHLRTSIALGCQWWVMWSEHKDGCTPYMKSVRFDQPDAPAQPVAAQQEPAVSHIQKWFQGALGMFHRA